MIEFIPLLACLAFSQPGHANDADQLKQLQPLNQKERILYQKARKKTTALHQFIVTRKYMRAVMAQLPAEMTLEQIQKIDGRQFAVMPKDIDIVYVISKTEETLLWKIMLDQGIP